MGLIVLLVLLTTSPAARAQVVLGGFVAVQMDTQEDFLAIGADALIPAGSSPVRINPGLAYFFQEDITEFQIDGNVVYFFDLEGDPRLEPFFAGGLAINYFSFDAGPGFGDNEETNIGLNVAAGASLRGNGAVTPFIEGQYTMIDDWPNRFLVSLGIRFGVGNR
jgi:hypothetical protein